MSYRAMPSIAANCGELVRLLLVLAEYPPAVLHPQWRMDFWQRACMSAAVILRFA